MSKEAIKLALEALELSSVTVDSFGVQKKTQEAITALREALAEQPARPYRLLQDNGSKYFGESWDKAEQPAQQALDKMAENARELGIQMQPAQQEPVAWIWKYANGEEEVVFVSPRHIDATHVDAPSTITPLYTSPPAQQEPVALKVNRGELCYKSQEDDQSFGMWCPVTPNSDLPFPDGTKFYTSPPAQRTWVGLTDEEIERACIPLGAAMLSFPEVARAIEAKLRSKNT